MLYNRRLKGSLVVEEIRSQVLQGNPLGDSTLRQVPVYLPPGYHKRSRKFPVIYVLAGLFGSPEGWLDFRAFSENVFQLADRLIAEGLPPFVLVCPDGFTRYGGSQYLNSTGTGRYMDHIIQELVPMIDESYSVDARREARALVGRSSGGFGALRLAMAHPDLFAHALSGSGDLYFRASCIGEIAQIPSLLKAAGGLEAFLAALPGLRRLDAQAATLLNVIALSSCYSPDPESPHGFRLPVDPESGELRPEVLDLLAAQDPAERLGEDGEALRSLQTLYVEAGNRDEYHADLGARVFAHRCRQAGIPVIHQEYDGGHSGGGWRYEVMFRLLAECFGAL
ncbi:MAG: esterase [Calditrichaeota bacterium]|nr:esterase [Calditrichota bacterium]